MLTPPYTFSSGRHTIYSNSGAATQLLQLCGYNDSIHNRNNVSNLLSDLLIRCGQDLQLLQNSYSSFDLISQIGEEICSQLTKISDFKAFKPLSTQNVYLRRKLLKRTPLAIDTLDFYTRQDSVLRDLNCITRSINIWAYGQPSEPDAPHVTPPSVTCISFDQTAKVIISGGDDGVIKLWHFHTGNLIMSLYRHSGSVTSVHVHPNNCYLISSCTGGECRLWDIRGSWWRMCCSVKTSFKILWCKFTRGYVPFKGQIDDLVVYASGDDTLKLHLLEDLLHGRDVPIRIINLSNLRAYDISEYNRVPWIAVGLEANDSVISLGGTNFGIGGVLDLDFEHCSFLEKKYIFSWNFDENSFKKLSELGILSQIKIASPLYVLKQGELSIKYSSNVAGSVGNKASSNFIVVSSVHKEPPDVCFSKTARNLITASDDGNAFLWNVYNGASVKLGTKCMEVYAKKCGETKPTEEGPLYRVTCLDWSCDDSLVYIGDSVYSRGNIRKSLSSMRTMESGFTVFDGTNGNLIGQALYGETNFHLSMIKSNPVVPYILLVANYAGVIYVYSCKNNNISLYKKIECGPGGCWLDILWHPSGSSFVISQKFGCFSIFTFPTFTYNSTPTLTYTLDTPNRLSEVEPPLGIFKYGYGFSTDFPHADFEPIHYSVLRDSVMSITQPEPSAMNDLTKERVDDLDIFQGVIDLPQYIYVHRQYNLDFDGIVTCFHHIQTRKFDLVKRFHDFTNCPICIVLIYGFPPTRQFVPTFSKNDVEYTRYGDHLACLPPSIQSQIEPKKERPVKPKPISILQKLVSIAHSETSSDSEDSDFTGSPHRDEQPERPRKHRRIYKTRTVLKRIKRVVKPAPPKPKLAELAMSSLNHLLNVDNLVNDEVKCSLCGVLHVCFLCQITGNKLESQALHYNNVIGDVDSRLIGPIIVDKEALDAITSAFGVEPVNDVYFHLFCLSSIDDITLGPGTIEGLDRVLYRANQTVCSFCSSKGAVLYCKSCNGPYHPRCSVEMYSEYLVFPSPIVGEFICLNCSKKEPTGYINGNVSFGFTFPWMIPDSFNLPVRATRSRLKAHMYYRRLSGKGSELVLPQQGDILWINSLVTEEGSRADEMLSFYLHSIELPFVVLVLETHYLFSGYLVEPARLTLKLKLQLVYPIHQAGLQFYMYTWRGDNRYTLVNKILLGLALQEQLVDQDNVLVYRGVGDWRLGKVVQVTKCRRLLEFEGEKDIMNQLTKAVEKSTSGNKIITETETVAASGWDLEPTGDPLSVVAGLAEKIMEEEYPKELRDEHEDIISMLEKNFVKELPEILLHRDIEGLGDSTNFNTMMGVPVPMTLKDIKRALSDGLLRQEESLDGFINTLMNNALVLGVGRDIIKIYTSHNNCTSVMIEDDVVGIMMDTDESKNKRRLVYVGHLPKELDQSYLRKFFAHFGEIKRVIMPKSEKTGNHKGYGFVEFKNPEAAKIAAKTMDMYFIDGRTLEVKLTKFHDMHKLARKNRTITEDAKRNRREKYAKKYMPLNKEQGD